MTSKLPHYVYTTNTLDDAHYIACKKVDQVCITISKKSKGYVHISFDTYSMNGELSQKDFNQLIDLYKSYTDLFDLPIKQREGAGGNTAFGFTVKEQHAEFIAEGLYHFIEHKRIKRG